MKHTKHPDNLEYLVILQKKMLYTCVSMNLFVQYLGLVLSGGALLGIILIQPILKFDLIPDTT